MPRARGYFAELFLGQGMGMGFIQELLKANAKSHTHYQVAQKPTAKTKTCRQHMATPTLQA
tara:strand:+ start:1996 stop:2178 length:183 start_codon:yes stop_codon:yes gene_type:complete